MCNRTFWMITHTHLFEHKFWRDLFLHHSFCCARAQDACKLAAIHFGSDWIKTIRNEFCNVLYQHRPQIAWKSIRHFRGLSNWFKIYKLQFYEYRHKEARYLHKYKENMSNRNKNMNEEFHGCPDERLWVVWKHMDLTLLYESRC